jgi:magnesium chelatase family protein
VALARTHSVALVGVEGHIVECEADIANGLVGMILVGLPDTALREARDRIRSAIVNSGEQWPQRRITVGLSPASLPKRGSGFDLPIACALLAAAGVLQAAALANACLPCDQSLSVNVLIAQVRSVVADLLLALGLDEEDALRAIDST